MAPPPEIWTVVEPDGGLGAARSDQDQLRESEQRFRTLVESTNNIVWLTDPTGVYPKPSPSWQRFTGQSEEMWTSGHGWDAIHLEDLSGLRVAWAAAVAGRTPFKTEYRLRRADGVYVPMFVHAAPVCNDDGSIREWIGTNIDISARLELLESERAARQEAEASRQRMALLDAVTKGLVGELQGTASMVQRLARLVVPELADWCTVYVPKSDGSIEPVALAHVDPDKVSAASELLLRFPISTDPTWGIAKVLRSGESELNSEITAELLGSVARTPEQLQALLRAGMRSQIAVPLKVHGKVIGCLSLVHAESGRRFTASDLALVEELGVRAALTLEQARLYQEMQAARAESEAANRSKDLFLAMLGHELRNPLSPILTALELMRLRGSEESFKERSIIERQVKHLVRLVDDLLDVSRITRGKIELTRENIEIADVITRAIETASPLLEQHGHFLSVLVPRKALQVNGDSARLAQVFSNLLTNSAKYSKAGSQIVITAKREADQIVVAVKDSGQGIDAQLLPYVFDLFSQGERTIDRSQGGLGIGLTIVRSLVQLHGGVVTAQSAGKGAGSEFQVRLPALGENPAVAAAPTSGPRSATALQRSLRVLVVDDNVDAAQLLFEALGMLGYTACIAHDGPSGLQAAIEFKPDVAFLDIGLPVMDGYELARRLHDWSSTVHLIAITGYGQDSDRRRSREAGFEQHLVKPLDLKRFRAILDELEKQKRSTP